MKDFYRNDLILSLCGLNCALCSMNKGGYCPGCGGGAGNQACAIARCSIEQGGFEYCFQCQQYPCEKYDGIDEYDSFITHRNQITDFEKIKRIGREAYWSEVMEKAEILDYLLSNYNDGRRKAFYCTAVNLLNLQDINFVMEQINNRQSGHMSLKEKAKLAVDLFQEAAVKGNVVLKLRKKPGQKENK